MGAQVSVPVSIPSAADARVGWAVASIIIILPKNNSTSNVFMLFGTDHEYALSKIPSLHLFSEY